MKRLEFDQFASFRTIPRTIFQCVAPEIAHVRVDACNSPAPRTKATFHTGHFRRQRFMATRWNPFNVK